ncbi:hypothetical protein JOF56_009913 [Kibdelosporangium banguiense]|uniref:Uncharacterized protein n=1 Tax=Kibdelosporangium banguiense TaxID=1365924 RepID=A0ABS4TZW3_9PSEU|nr:hypothetical protein [Kibdelosporangium banguiense]MBP2329528.1 hypothetical protein [Kibdelosporangium banguiense]
MGRSLVFVAAIALVWQGGEECAVGLVNGVAGEHARLDAAGL